MRSSSRLFLLFYFCSQPVFGADLVGYHSLLDSGILEQSEVILIGDVHGANYFDQMEAWSHFNRTVVSPLAQPGDVVLYEGIPYGSNADDVHWDFGEGAPRSLVFDGWEPPKEYSDALADLTLRLRHIETIKEPTREEEISDAGLHLAVHQLTIYERNMALAANVMDARKKHLNHRIFVLAGIAHFADPAFSDFLKSRTFPISVWIRDGAEKKMGMLEDLAVNTVLNVVSKNKGDTQEVLQTIDNKRKSIVRDFWQKLGMTILNYDDIKRISDIAASALRKTCESEISGEKPLSTK